MPLVRVIDSLHAALGLARVRMYISISFISSRRSGPPITALAVHSSLSIYDQASMKVFITGASGYIGSAITKELTAHGHTVLGLARSDVSAARVAALGAEVYRGSIDDLELLRTGAAAADGVVHCAFDYGDFSDMDGAQRKDNEAIEAIGSALLGTNKPFVISSGTLLLASGTTSQQPTEETAAPLEGFLAGRAKSEQIVINFAEKGVRSAVIRLPPTVHGGDLAPLSFIRQMTAVAAKHGFAGYIGDGAARWPAVNVFDVAILYRLVLESGEPGRCYHGVADEGNRLLDVAKAIGGHLNLPMQAVSPEDARSHWGFISHIMQADNPTTNILTRKWTGWQPTRPSLIDELKAGTAVYYAV